MATSPPPRLTAAALAPLAAAIAVAAAPRLLATLGDDAPLATYFQALLEVAGDPAQWLPDPAATPQTPYEVALQLSGERLHVAIVLDSRRRTVRAARLTVAPPILILGEHTDAPGAAVALDLRNTLAELFGTATVSVPGAALWPLLLGSPDRAVRTAALRFAAHRPRSRPETRSR